MCMRHTRKLLATVLTLEKEIERLNCTQAHLQSRGQHKSRDHRSAKPRGQEEECTAQSGFKDQPVPHHVPPTPRQNLVSRGPMAKAPDLEEFLDLKPVVASFLRGSPKSSEDEDEEMFLEPPVLEFK